MSGKPTTRVYGHATEKHLVRYVMNPLLELRFSGTSSLTAKFRVSFCSAFTACLGANGEGSYVTVRYGYFDVCCDWI
ncbi:hypothetical protein QZH41_015345 [Actinostola sp. cb2023]|nr:hypothetical protein QZH41_015345 [Actinostola sp. cb2023]